MNPLFTNAQDQEHRICFTSCQELDLSLHVPYLQENNSIALGDLEFAWKSSLSPILTTSVFDLLLKRIDLDLKLPVKGFLNDPSCLSTRLVNSFFRSSKGFK